MEGAGQTLSRHDFLQTIAFDQEFLVTFQALGVVLLFLVDDCTTNSGNSLPFRYKNPERGT
jgi:hypothetical protein